MTPALLVALSLALLFTFTVRKVHQAMQAFDALKSEVASAKAAMQKAADAITALLARETVAPADIAAVAADLKASADALANVTPPATP